jgi:dipeptidyl aminopeptidase/acylaminoacyl peptidase
MKTSRLVLSICLLSALALPLAAQQKRALDHGDYAIWKRIQNDVLSDDGEWLAYRLVPGEGDATLILRSLDSDRTLAIERGASPRFSADSRHLVALVEPSEAEVDQAEEEGLTGPGAPKDDLIIVALSDLSTTTVERVRSFELPDEGDGWMAYHLEAREEEEAPEVEEAEAEEGEDSDQTPRLDDGTTLVVRTLGSAQERRFDHVADYAFAADGSVLYYTASGLEGEADGVFRVGRSGDAEAVTTGEGRYVQLAVSDEGVAAFLSDRDDREDEAPDFALYVARAGDAAERRVGRGDGDGPIPAGWTPSEFGNVSFSETGDRVFFGTALAPEPEIEDDVPEDERVVVDIWNWKDPLLQPNQLVQVEEERERTYEAMLDLENGQLRQLATTEVPNVSLGDDGDGAYALGTSGLPYRQLISWDRRYSDLYVIDLEDGSRDMVAEMVPGGGTLSPSGRYITRWDGFEKAWFAIDVQSGEEVNLTGAMSQPFHDLLDDHPDALRSYGSAGWTAGDEEFVVYDQYDIWALDPTGRSAPRNLTEGVGRRTDTRYRYLDTDDEDPFVPTDEDVYLTSFHLSTKAAGIYRDRFDERREPTELISGDVRFARVRLAENDADVVTFTRQTFREFPDIWVTNADFEDARKVTDANPQQSQYLWGTAELVEWTSNDGIPLQGILYKPEGFDPTRQYPMMVYFYERNSDGLHGYTIPAAGSSSINRSFYVSRGYLLFVPDIPYKIGYPGESAVDAVVPGVLQLVDQGFVDRGKIGVQGHSWGGYQIAYMVTRTDLFAAAEAGAPVSNMISAYGGIRWQSGLSRMMQYERTQSRIGGSLWEKPLRFIENSPIFTADKISTPLLMMHNDEDGAVPWYQGIELFVGLRRLGQPVWMLNYNGEAHGLRQEHNQKDWAIRMQQFFDHYLMDAPAPVWMEDGVPAVLKGKTLGLELTEKRVISEEGERQR